MFDYDNYAISIRLLPDSFEVVMRWPDVYIDNDAIEIPVMVDVMVDLVRHEANPMEDTPNIREPSLLETELAIADDVDCTQQSLGSMGDRDDAEESYDDNQVISFKPYTSVQSMALFWMMLSLSSSNQLLRNFSNVVVLRRFLSRLATHRSVI